MSAIDPEDPRLTSCDTCGRPFHLACANVAPDEEGPSSCLECVPPRNSCHCGTLRHFPMRGARFSGTWIACDKCDRWCHAECCCVDPVLGSAYEYSMDGQTCLDCDASDDVSA